MPQRSPQHGPDSMAAIYVLWARQAHARGDKERLRQLRATLLEQFRMRVTFGARKPRKKGVSA